MKKVFFLLTALVFLNGCAESVALLGSSVGGASSGRALQSSLSSTLSYGVKHKTGKTPIGHVLDYAKEINPEKKRETCISFIESTRSEFCTIAKKQMSITKNAVKKKVFEVSKKHTNTDKIKEVILDTKKELKDVYQFKKSPRELAIVFQSKMKNME